MADNKLRLEIVTQLDAAGIKATKDQVDQLELGLRRTGNSAADSGRKFGGLEKALGRLPGPLGQIGSSLGGLAGQAAMVAGAFSMGVEIGNKIMGVAEKWGLIKDPIKELVAENKAYERSLQALKSSLDEVTAAEVKRMEASASAADRALKKIDEQTAAYFRQVTSLEGLKKAEGNAEMIQLERAKFEDMKAYADAGYTEAAEQIGKYYDVLEAELTAKQQLAAFDRESAKMDGERVRNQEAYALATERATAARGKANAAAGELAAFRSKNGIGGNAFYDNSADAARDDALEKIAERAARDAEKAEAEMARRGAKLETIEADALTRQMERANLVANGTLGVDRAASAYDDYVKVNGNPLNAEIDANWAAELLTKTSDASRVQTDILAELRAFTQKFETLLEMK